MLQPRRITPAIFGDLEKIMCCCCCFCFVVVLSMCFTQSQNNPGDARQTEQQLDANIQPRNCNWIPGFRRQASSRHQHWSKREGRSVRRLVVRDPQDRCLWCGLSAVPDLTHGTIQTTLSKQFTHQQIHYLLNLEKFKIYIKIHTNIALTCFGLRPSSGSLYWTWLKLYLC